METSPFEASSNFGLAKRGYAYLIASVAAISGLLFGFDIAVINGALVFIRQQFGLNELQTEVGAGSLLLGCAAGALFSGRASDRFGRRRVLMGAAILFAVSSVAAGLPNHLNEFIAARLLAGIATGTASMLAPLYIAETSPPRIRGRLVAFNQMAIVIGILLAYLVNWRLAAIGPDGWRWMFGAAAFPAAALWIALLFVPESPRWLVQRGYAAEAELVLVDLVGSAEAEVEMRGIREAIANESGSIRELFTRRFRAPLVIAVSLAILQQITGVNTVLYYGSLIFHDQMKNHSTSSALGLNVLIGLINFVGTLVAIWLIDRLGRKPLLLISSGSMAVALFVIGMTFRMNPLPTSLMLGFILLYVFAFSIGMGPGVWVLLSELFPTQVRGRAMAIATVFLWLASLLLTATFLSLVTAIGSSGTFWTYAVLSAGTFLFVALKVPETKKKSLEEIEQMWGKS
jgi:sugar porter (SP) family MFS transporter